MPGYISVIQQEYNKNVGDIMARINIPFIVKKQVIVQRPRIKIAAGGQHYFYATFDLCDVWDDIEDKPNIAENLRNATTKKAGCVRKGTGVQNLSNDAGISDIISTINNLLSSLRTAGILNSIIWEK